MFDPKTADEALHAIGALFELGDIIEIRALGVGRTPDRQGVTYAGYFEFENEIAIRKAVLTLDGRSDGIYVVLNRLDRTLLARANNRLQAKPKSTTSDKDIIEMRWIYIDCDPVRPAGVSATEEEHAAALERARQIRAFLHSCGWPEPIFSDSGNGAHLLYLLPKLKVDRAHELCKACLKSLTLRFSDQNVTVDEATANPSRLCKLYGTLTRKGDSTNDRPYRRSRILDDPEQIRSVPLEVLEALASLPVVEPPTLIAQAAGVVRSTFQIDNWLSGSNLDIVKGPTPYNGGRIWILRNCPFDSEHQRPAIIELSGGALVYKCLHRSCEQNNWRAFRTLFEPGYVECATPGTRHGTAVSSLMSTRYADEEPGITDLSQIPSVWSLEMKLNWCVEDLIAEGSVTLICAESGTGKTWLGYYIAGCIAHGLPVIGRPSRHSKVLYLDGENPLYLVKQRLLDLGITEAPDLTVWGGWLPKQPPGPGHPLIVEFARQHKGLMIFDSLIEFHTGSEQSSTETREFMRQFKALANLGATVVVLHNTGKSESARLYRGSSDIKAAVDTAYLLEKVSGEQESLGKLSLTCFKGRLMPGQNFGLEYIKGRGFVASAHLPRKKSLEEFIGEALENNPGINQSNLVRLAGAAGFSKQKVLACLAAGPWSKQLGSRNAKLYYLPNPDGTGGES